MSLDYDARHVEMALVSDGYLFVLGFGETGVGTIDLVACVVVAYDEPMPRIPDDRGNTAPDRHGRAAYERLMNRVWELTALFPKAHPGKPLTAQQLRLPAGPLLARARHQLRTQGAPLLFPAERERIGGKPGPPRESDDFLIALCARYAEIQAETGRGARRRLAAERGVSDERVRDWLTTARRHGLWKTAGPGLVGEPARRD